MELWAILKYLIVAFGFNYVANPDTCEMSITKGVGEEQIVVTDTYKQEACDLVLKGD